MQEQLKEAVKTIIDLVKRPFHALRDAIAKVIKTVKVVVERIKAAMLAIKRLVLSIREYFFFLIIKKLISSKTCEILLINCVS